MGIGRKFARACQRASFKLGVALPPRRRAAIPEKIFFVHVPKCAGSSLNGYLKTYLGSASSGASVFFNDIFTAQETLPVGQRKIEVAKTAHVVSGHYSWAVVDEIAPGNKAFMATVLRDPVSRLMSLYNYTTGMPTGRLKTQIDGLHGMDADTFFTSEDPRIQHALDNYVTRQFAGRFDVMGEDVAELVGPAAERIRDLDFIGFVEEFDRDFPRLAGQLGLPLPKAAPRVNVSQPLLDDAGRAATAFDRLGKPAQNAIARYVQFDRVIYDQAIERRDARLRRV